MCDGQQNEWFQEWFDSPYYHILYRNRDESEAEFFLERLLGFIKISEGSSILDLACGKGRHSVFLHSKGYRVTGVDLSAESIAIAQKHEIPGLHFERQDMRTLHLPEKFECIMNLFTSFGYFANLEENRRVLELVRKHLKPGGLFVLDYFNANKVRKMMQPCFHSSCGRVEFDIKKKIVDGQIVKEIGIKDGDKEFHFQEQVQLLGATELEGMLGETGLTKMAVFGNYALQPFEPETSDRFIIIARN